MSKVEKNVQNAFTRLVENTHPDVEMSEDIQTVGMALGYSYDELVKANLIQEPEPGEDEDLEIDYSNSDDE